MKSQLNWKAQDQDNILKTVNRNYNFRKIDIIILTLIFVKNRILSI